LNLTFKKAFHEKKRHKRHFVNKKYIFSSKFKCNFYIRIRILNADPDPATQNNADPDPYPDPNWIRIQSGQWIRIRNPDPDPTNH
jgi:hypothetical protein